MTRGLIHPMVYRGEEAYIWIGTLHLDPSSVFMFNLRVPMAWWVKVGCTPPHEGYSWVRNVRGTQSQCSENWHDSWNWVCVPPFAGETTWSIVWEVCAMGMLYLSMYLVFQIQAMVYWCSEKIYESFFPTTFLIIKAC